MALATAGGAQAQAPIVTAPSLPTPAPEPPAPSARASQTVQAAPTTATDGLGPRDVYIEADTVIDDRDNKVITATGGVEARYQGRTLRADQLIYDTARGTAHAHGHAVILNADGTSQYAEDIELDDQMRAGVATAFSARLQDNVTLSAGAAIKRSETINELNSAIYTVCDICAKDGSSKAPTWSVQASRIFQDSESHLVYYRNAVIRVKGIPILYTPVFWHADPTAERRSGFLTPRFRYSGRRGLSYEQPYLWAISPSSDLVVSPQFATDVAPFVNFDLRKRFYSGEVDIRAGYTYERRFDNDGKFGPRASRAYVLAHGQFQPTEKWTYGFGVEQVNDDTIFTRYNVDDVYQTRGLFIADAQRLINQVYGVRQDRSSYLSISMVDFQSLRVFQINRQLVSYDLPDAFPVVAPLIEARINPERPVLGGRLHLLASAVVLTRDQTLSKATPLGLTQNQLINSRRATGRGDWRRTMTFSNGLRVEPFAQARADLYSIDNPLSAKQTGAFGRAQATVGTDLSIPFIRNFNSNTSLILEPMAQLAVSPRLSANTRIPNEDSRAFDFDTSNLFSLNRFPGFDESESGARMNLGGRATARWKGGDASFLVGRVLRAAPDRAFSATSGLSGTTSDWVTAATLTPMAGIRLFTRARLDSDNLSVKRQESGIDAGFKRLAASVRYSFNDADVTGVTTESIQYAANAFITDRWGVGYSTSKDLQSKLSPVSQFSLIYRDECVRLDVVYTHDTTYNSRIAPSNSITIRLTLATLGGTRTR